MAATNSQTTERGTESEGGRASLARRSVTGAAPLGMRSLLPRHVSGAPGNRPRHDARAGDRVEVRGDIDETEDLYLAAQGGQQVVQQRQLPNALHLGVRGVDVEPRPQLAAIEGGERRRGGA